MLHGFQITHGLYESEHSVIYRATRTADQRPVVLKMLNSEYPSPREIARFRQELSLLEAARGPGVIEAYGLERMGHTLLLVLEDFGGESLDQAFRNQRPSLERFLQLAIRAAAAIGHIHRRGVIHKDITPSNMVWNRDTAELKLIDFGIATQLASEGPPRSGPRVIEGSMAYVSPEQTGRMNRHFDYRTDFYSLGVTLYQLLTGSLPFPGHDPLELVHCHIAAQPRPPIELRADTPLVLSEIIMKLLAKGAEERYQSAWGLEADLVRCYEQLRAGHTVGGFRLASEDASDRLEIPQKLYGRWRETQMLLQRFDHAREGGRDLVLVTGYSGVGKSSLVRELYEPATQGSAILATGKFDLLQRGTPYSAISTTFSDLVKQLLAGSSSELAQWKIDLLTALGPNARLLTDVIPALELLIGSQPAVEPSGPSEMQNRLSLAFRDFLRVFCRPAHPLVVFLDDLQWADPASLHLIESMMTDDSLVYFLLIGAYRDSEVDGTHPLALLLDGVRARIPVTRIHLDPLGLEDVCHLLADALHVAPGAVGSLAEHVLHKTGGNPFFLQTFLRLLHEDGLIAFDAGQAGWRWNMAEIQATPATDNVAELLSVKLRKLPDEVQHTLRLAACVGNRFDLHTLSIISERSIPEIYGSLMEATHEGLIEPASEPEIVPDGEREPRLLVCEYEFVHDRIQQAAFALIPAHERPAIHLDVGRLLWSKLAPARREERLLELVDHLNLGRGLLDVRPEPSEWTPAALAGLNLEAGQRAREAAAYEAAWRYLEIGCELVGEQWDEHYELMLALRSEAAEVAYCRGDLERSRHLIEATLPRARSVMAKIRLHRLAIIQHTNEGRVKEAFDGARVAFALLSQSLPAPDALAAAWKEDHAHIARLLGDRPIQSLVDAPAMTSELHQAALDLISELATTAFLADVALFDFLATRAVRLSLEHGHTRSSAIGYAIYGMMLAARLDEHQRACDFCELALALTERWRDPGMKCRAGTAMIAQVYHWARPLRRIDDLIVDCFRAGLQAGELQSAAFLLSARLPSHFYQGMNLERIREEAPAFVQFCLDHKNAVSINSIEAGRMAADYLSGAGDEGTGHDMADDAAFVERCRTGAGIISLGMYYTLRCHTMYVLERYHDALAAARAAQELLPYLRGTFSAARLSFSHALCLAALIPDASPEQADEHRRSLAVHRQQLASWAQNCPENFRHLELLITAELARISDDDVTAVRCYGEAVACAEAGELRHDLALAHELAARFWLSRRQPRYAHAHLEDAYYAYATWGAQRKCAQLEAQYPQLVVRFKRGRPVHMGTALSTTARMDEHLDLASVLKASQAISSEIALDRLLVRLIAVLIENAGAQYGALIIEHRDELMLEAQGVLGKDVRVLQPVPLAQAGPAAERIVTAVVHYVLRTRELVVLHDAAREGPFVRDPHVVATRPRSILCMPLLHHGQLRGALYLANHLSAQAFTADRVELLQMLSSQIAISLENARLYHNLGQTNQELEQLLYSVTHDLKEPLRAVRSFSELVVRRYEHALDDHARDYLERVMQASQRLRDLIEAMRVITKIRRSTGPRQHTAGADLVQDALLRLAPIVAETRAEVRVAPDLPVLAVERYWAVEAVYQLVHNALQFTHAGQRPDIDILPYQGSEGTGLLIQDRGLGVPAEDTDRLFDLFRRVVGREVPGIGAGLTLVRQVAARHDGVAWLRPRADGGTAAYITFGR